MGCFRREAEAVEQGKLGSVAVAVVVLRYAQFCGGGNGF
jgi:hypothetical protein